MESNAGNTLTCVPTRTYCGLICMYAAHNMHKDNFMYLQRPKDNPNTVDIPNRIRRRSQNVIHISEYVLKPGLNY